MGAQLESRSDFTETLAIHVALKSAIRAKKFQRNAAVRKAAASLCTDLESDRSIFGRQLQMLRMMERGASLAELGRKLRCSRRTVFRYLNHLEDAGIGIDLLGNRYKVERNISKLIAQ